MKDERTMAFINLYGVLGTLPRLCQLDPSAAALIRDITISVGFTVKDGPAATLYFDHGACRIQAGCEKCDIRLPFGSCQRFNGMIDGTVTPIPSKGFTKISFLLKTFIQLTNKLSAYLKATPEQLKDEAFFTTSTLLMFRVIAGAVAQIGNQDPIGRISASYIPDGLIRLEIGDTDAAALQVQAHQLTLLEKTPAEFSSYMRFKDIHLARALFDGKVNSVCCIGSGEIRVGGLINQVDNVNRILDRVAGYLA